MANTLIVPAPAKINLFLHVVGRRASDGYHLLESAMVLLAFGDTLTLTRRHDGQIQLHTPVANVPAEQNLCVRAALALQSNTQCPYGVDISIEKRIPMGAGLGGGSSDAASVLLALNRLWDCNLSKSTLIKIGLTLGADVPFFVFGRAAFARGVGEVLSPLTLPIVPITLLMPNAHTPTPLIFSQPDLVRDTAAINIDALPLSAGKNDLQPVAERLFPAIRMVRQTLGSGARMTGSGACVFELLRTRSTTLPFDAEHVINTHNIARHPLHSFADD